MLGGVGVSPLPRVRPGLDRPRRDLECGERLFEPTSESPSVALSGLRDLPRYERIVRKEGVHVLAHLFERIVD